MITTGNLSLQSWCYTSVGTNAIAALFAETEEHREVLPRELIPWEVVGLSAPRQAARLSWAGHCRQELCVSPLPFSREAGRVRDVGWKRMEKEPHGRHGETQH